MAMDQFSEWRLKSQKMELENDFYFDYETEEIANYQDPSVLLAALKQKEEEVILAAQLGNALLLENRQLKEESEKLHEQYADKLEALKQDRHELQLKLEGCQSQWEAQVGELERDSGELSSQVARLSQALGEAEKDKARVVEEHGEHTQLLREQLSTAMEAEKSMSNELQALKQELRQRGDNRPQDEELLSAMREQVARLTQKELALKERLEIVFQENADLRQSLASLHTRLAHQDRCTEEQRQQLAEACCEAEAARGRSQELQSQVEELQEEVSLQSSGCRGDASLLSELETSLDSVRLDCTCSDNKQLTQDVLSVLQLLLPLTQQTNVPIDSGVKGQEGGLQALLHQLKGVAQTLTRTCCTQELNSAFVEGWRDLRGNRSVTQQQRDQNTKLQEENDALRLRLKNREEEKEEEEKGIAWQAIKDRDEAISKKNLMEVELVRTKSDMMCLNNQLLEAIQRKLELSQELEAWQDDIQVIINQQLRAQQQTEQLQRKPASNPMAFFRRPSTAPSTWARRPSASPSWASEACQEKPQSPWRDWLRRGKVAQHGK